MSIVLQILSVLHCMHAPQPHRHWARTAFGHHQMNRRRCGRTLLSVIICAWVIALVEQCVAQQQLGTTAATSNCTNRYDDAGRGSCADLLTDFPCDQYFAEGRAYEGYCDR